MSLHYNRGKCYLYVNKTEICKFKMHVKIPWYKFCLGNLSKDFTKDEMSKLSLNSTVYGYSVDQSEIEKEDILNIHDYLMKSNNAKRLLRFIKQAFITLLSFSRLLATKCISLNNEPCLVRATLIDLNSDEHNQGLPYFPFIMKSCNTLGNLSRRIWALDKTKDEN